MNSIKIAVALGATAVVVGLGSPASAVNACGGADTLCGSIVSAQESDLGPYATPLAALGGRTLAQYLADHQADRAARSAR